MNAEKCSFLGVSYFKFHSGLFAAVIHEPDGPTPSSQFEHSSIPATVKKLFNLKTNFLTKRDAWAGTFEKYFSLRKTPRDDCPGMYQFLEHKTKLHQTFLFTKCDFLNNEDSQQNCMRYGGSMN